jgi:hypothetical protein
LQIEWDRKIGKLSAESATLQSVEILTALKKLGEKLTVEEDSFMHTHSSNSLRQFEEVTGEIGKCFI